MSGFYFEILNLSLSQRFILLFYCSPLLSVYASTDAFNGNLETYGKGIYLSGLIHPDIEMHFIPIPDLRSAIFLLPFRGAANLYCLPYGSLR